MFLNHKSFSVIVHNREYRGSARDAGGFGFVHSAMTNCIVLNDELYRPERIHLSINAAGCNLATLRFSVPTVNFSCI